MRELTFNGHEIRVVIINDEYWFVAKDLYESMEAKKYGHSTRLIDDRFKRYIVCQDSTNKVNRYLAISTPGAIQIATSMRRPKASALLDWLKALPPANQSHKQILVTDDSAYKTKIMDADIDILDELDFMDFSRDERLALTKSMSSKMNSDTDISIKKIVSVLNLFDKLSYEGKIRALKSIAINI